MVVDKRGNEGRMTTVIGNNGRINPFGTGFVFHILNLI